MKTAISIPDPIFQSAEGLAKRLRMSRSELYVKAIVQYLSEHKRDNVTEALNCVYGEIDSSLEKGASIIQMKTLKRQSKAGEEW